MLGYKEDSGSLLYSWLDKTCKQVVLSRDVLFDETAKGETAESGARTTTQIGSTSEVLPGNSAEIERSLLEKEHRNRGETPSEEEVKEQKWTPVPPIDPDD